MADTIGSNTNTAILTTLMGSHTVSAVDSAGMKDWKLKTLPEWL